MQIDASLRDNPTVKQIKAATAAEALNSSLSQLVNAQKMVGGEKIPALKPDASVEDTAKWMQQYMGVPETADKYTIPEKVIRGVDSKGEPVEYPVDPAIAERMKQYAHKNHLKPSQAEGVLADFLADEAAQSKAQEEAKMKAIQDGLASLTSEWGREYDVNMDAANAGYARLVPEGLKATLANYPELTNHPDMIKLFADLGKQIQDDTFRNTGTSGREVHSPSQAMAAIETLERSDNYIKMLRKDPSITPEIRQHIEQQRVELYKKAYPS